jgi:lysophospholipase L1-like esterase
VLCAAAAWASPAAASKIACVGDSITYGYNLSNPSTESYPAVLQTLLGNAHTVKNFGSSGCTLLKKGDKPYWNDTQFSASDSFKPDVVVVMLGTNDAKSQNWSHQAEFTGDYNSMIDHYRGLGALVYVAVPPPVVSPGNFQIDPNVLNTQIVPLVRQLAMAASAPTIDVYQAFSGKSSLLPDTVHPNAEGAKLIAQTVQAALQQGGYGGYAGTGGASSVGGTQGIGGMKSTGGAPATGGSVAAGGAVTTGGRSATLGLGGTLSAGGVATTLAVVGGALSSGGASRASGGATTASSVKTTGGQPGAGGTSNTVALTSSATLGGATASTSGSHYSGSGSGGLSSVEDSSTRTTGGSSSTVSANVGNTATTQAGHAEFASLGGSRQSTGTSGTNAVASSQTTNPERCGCRVHGHGVSSLAAGFMALLAIAARRRRRALVG